ncbi:MAG TPA: flagellar basal body-associated FliL family protein [Gallionella sp.]|nr:flagellar basal body-associated FliL family protein [Gallionella sp.]
MSKPAKSIAGSATDTPPKKSKKKLIIIILVMMLLTSGGVAAFLLLKPVQQPTDTAQGEEHIEEAKNKVPVKFVDLGTFTANLMQEQDDRYLQVTISLKLTQPELEGKIKERNPEILHRVNMLLQSKRPSELASIAGKEQLAQQIKGQVEYVLDLRKTAPDIVEYADAKNAAEAAPAELPESKDGVAEVLFTSFIIQ